MKAIDLINDSLSEWRTIRHAPDLAHELFDRLDTDEVQRLAAVAAIAMTWMTWFWSIKSSSLIGLVASRVGKAVAGASKWQAPATAHGGAS